MGRTSRKEKEKKKRYYCKPHSESPASLPYIEEGCDLSILFYRKLRA